MVGAVEIIFGKQKCSTEMFVFVKLFQAFVIGNITATASIVHRIFDQRFRDGHFDAIIDTVIIFSATAVGSLQHGLILKVNLLQYLERFGRQQRFVGQI